MRPVSRGVIIMKKVIIVLSISLLIISGCGKREHRAPVGIKSFDEIFEISKMVFKNADSDLLLEHVDLSGMPTKTEPIVHRFLKNWIKDDKRWKLKVIEVLSFEDYDPNADIPEQWTEDLRKRFYQDKNKLWNIPPSKIIIFREELKVQKTDIDREASRSLTFGTFQRNGLWYFACIR
jgi:hypothetical protein